MMHRPFVAVAVAIGLTIPVFAQDPVTALPDAYKLELALLPRLAREGAPLTLIGEMKRCV